MNAPADTRCLLLTPPGAGAIGLIRLEGPLAAAIIQQVFLPAGNGPLESTPSRCLRYGVVHDGAEPIDDVIVVRSDSATAAGFEITAHGGVRVLERIAQVLEHCGARLVDAGIRGPSNWPTRDLIEADALGALMRAKTARAVRFLCWQRQHLAAALRTTAARCAANPGSARSELERMVQRYHAARRLLDGATIVLVGPANSGKSTLYNLLVGRSAVVVSPRAGTTRDWVAETIEIEGMPATIVDTAGWTVNAPDLEQLAVDAGREVSKTADLAVLVLDGSTPLPDLRGLMGDDPTPPAWHLIVANKMDLGQAWDESAVWFAEGRESCGFNRISARHGTGLDSLVQDMVARSGILRTVDSKPCLFSDRQMRAVQDALACLDRHPARAAAILETQLIGRSAGDA